MSESEGERGVGVGARVMLECGHWLSLPLGLAPVAAAAEFVHHHSVCEPEPTEYANGAGSQVPPAWLPLPGLPR